MLARAKSHPAKEKRVRLAQKEDSMAETAFPLKGGCFQWLKLTEK